MNILGISAFYHDSAAVLIRDGEITSAVQEERFSRKKHDHRFPNHSVEYCLETANLSVKDLDSLLSHVLQGQKNPQVECRFAPPGTARDEHVSCQHIGRDAPWDARGRYDPEYDAAG